MFSGSSAKVKGTYLYATYNLAKILASAPISNCMETNLMYRERKTRHLTATD